MKIVLAEEEIEEIVRQHLRDGLNLEPAEISLDYDQETETIEAVCEIGLKEPTEAADDD